MSNYYSRSHIVFNLIRNKSKQVSILAAISEWSTEASGKVSHAHNWHWCRRSVFKPLQLSNQILKRKSGPIIACTAFTKPGKTT